MTQNLILVILLTTTLITTVLTIFYLRTKRRDKNGFKYYDSKKYIVSVTTGVIMLSTMVISFYLKFNESGRIIFDRTHSDDNLIIKFDSLRNRLEYLKLKNDSFHVNFSRLDTISITTSSTKELQKLFEYRISKIEDEVLGQKEITTSLRQAINPMKPEEVLTIARLKDEVIELNKSIAALDESLKIRQQNFEDSIKREITSSNSSTTLILVVLIPLVLNFLYTLWKDFKKPDQEKKEEAKTT